LHTLPLPPPLEPKPRDEVDRQRLERGLALFAAWNCGECHVGPLTYTSQGSYDVGLRDERGLAKFNPPSLRGVGHGAAFFHDNRAQTLDEGFRVYGHRVPDNATDADFDALVRFLRSL
jgi:cytochrome c peroxidase